MKNKDILQQLISKKPENIRNLQSWSFQEFDEMAQTYVTALEIADESNDLEAKVILEEKLLQLAEARQIKDHRSGDVQL